MENIHYMFLAFLISWLVIAGYLWSLGRQVQNLREEMRMLYDEETRDRSEHAS